jgi:hypothetical protein
MSRTVTMDIIILKQNDLRSAMNVKKSDEDDQEESGVGVDEDDWRAVTIEGSMMTSNGSRKLGNEVRGRASHQMIKFSFLFKTCG